MKRTRPQADDFKIGWICALPLEYFAAKAVLDDLYDESDEYTTGRIHSHEIVIACLPAGQYGTNAAAAATAKMVSAFPSLKFGLLVGVAGGVPSSIADIRLGDVVVSQPEKTYGGVVQYDLGRTLAGGSHQLTGFLNSPAPVLLTAVSKFKANLPASRNNIKSHLTRVNVQRPSFDWLFDPSYDHVGGETCNNCRTDKIPERECREDSSPEIFFGTVASGNQVIKDGITRDQKSLELGGVLCFEMEAAGVMNQLPSLVIRGICDYADSHKNKEFQPYAAATAAACAKDILSYVPSVPRTTHEKPADIVCKLGTGDNEMSHKVLSVEMKQTYLESLGFDQINTRHLTIRMAHVKTCQWLLKSHSYKEWLDPEYFSTHHGFLWIKGKPGTGKSTLIKFASAKAARQLKTSTIISFFFNARGDTLEKSVQGLYRSLLFQLLDKFADLQDVFGLLPQATHNSQSFEWDIETLKFLFNSAVEKLQNRSLLCYIDALDECDEDQVRDMLSFFEQLGELAALEELNLRVCFSSRHYPHIAITKGIELILEDQEGHQQDISTYVHSELRAKHNKQIQEIKEQVIARASGIFLWVVLVIQILNKEHDAGRVHTLKRRLNEIPDGLHELLKDILTRDNHNMATTILCLQWILHAKRPLSREELYFAILAGVEDDPDFLTEWTIDNVNEEDITKYILDSSKGLAEITRSKGPTVQFIHESVRDFLNDDGLSNLQTNIGTVSPSSSHEALKRCCLKYMVVNLSLSFSIPSPLPKAKSEDSKHLRQVITEKYPFLEYAINNVLYHADSASRYGISQRLFLQVFPLEEWIPKNNLFEIHDNRRYTPEAEMLYVIAEKNYAKLINTEIQLSRFSDTRTERYRHPLIAAVRLGSDEAAYELLNENCYTRDLLENHYRKDTSLLHHAVRRGNVTLLTMLFDRGAELESRGQSGRTLLSHAASSNNGYLVQFLLDRGAKLESRDSDGYTPLYHAVFSGNKNIIQLLLDRGAGLESIDNSGRTPLSHAASSGVAQLLLDRGAGLESRDNSGRTPLSHAVSCNYKDIVQLLLDQGAKLESRDYYGRTPLSHAASSTNEELVHLLLDRGADLKSRDNSGRTPLSHAASSGVAQLLLDRGAGLESRDNSGRTPLSHAVSSNYKDIVQLLLDRGAELQSRDNDGRTPFSHATTFRVAQLLLDRGAKLVKG